MNGKNPARGALCATLVSTLVFAPSVFGQTTNASQSAPQKPVPVEKADEEQVQTKEGELYILSPFEVNATTDKGYRATQTMAGSRLNTQLKDVGSAVQIVTSDFLRDTSAKNSQDLLVYTTNTEVSGIGGNFLGAGGAAVINSAQANIRTTPDQSTRVRGLTAADNTRDYFLTDAPWDSYNTERIELQRGPNSILFGNGSPAGIINSGIRGASYKEEGSIEATYGSYSSARGSLDYNHVLLKDELAIRVDGLDDHKYYEQKPAYSRDVREFIAGRYDPSFLKFDSARTTIKFNFENGKINANYPDPTPPLDAITQWFAMGKPRYDARYTFASDAAMIAALPGTGAGVLQTGSANYNPWINRFGRLYDNVAFIYGNPNSGKAGGAGFPVAITGTSNFLQAPGASLTLYKPQASGNLADPYPAIATASIPAAPLDASMVGITSYDDYAVKANLPGSQLGVYKAKSLTDSSIFDFYNNLLGGPNDGVTRDWQTFNLDLSQTFLDNRLGFDVAYNREHSHQSQEFMFQGFANAITVDINTTLADGSPNPNFGRPAVTSDSGYNSETFNKRGALRATAFGELRFSDFMDKSSLLARLLGRHVFTGLMGNDSREVTSVQWSRYATDDVYGKLIATSGVLSPNRQIATISYLGASLADASSASGAHLSPITALQQPTSTTGFRNYNSVYASNLDPNGDWINPATNQPYVNATDPTKTLQNKNNPANYPNLGFPANGGTTNLNVWNADLGNKEQLYTGGSKTKSTDSSTAFVWQGFFWDETFVPTMGLRKDRSKYYSAGTVPNNPNATANPNDPNWGIPGTANYTVDGTTRTIGAVLHTPKDLAKRLPWGTTVSLTFNKSKNFNPDPSRTGIYGESLPAPVGDTKDYGFVISTLDDRIVLRVNRYETKVQNATLSGGVPGNFYMVYDSEAWGYMFAMQAKNHYGNFATDYVPAPGQTQAQATAEETLAVDTFLAHLQPDSFWKANQITAGSPANAAATEAWKGWMQGNGNPSLAITGDTISKGTEFELTGRITEGWDVTVNASRTDATQTNLAKSVSDWIEARHTFFAGPAGKVREWNNAYSLNEDLQHKFDQSTYAAYQLEKLQEGGNVPELRPWRLNIVTNYAFGKDLFGGALKGVNVGAGYRWQDKQVIGYALTADNSKVDINHPYKSGTLTNIDFWLGYEHKLTKKLVWRIQFNAKNLFGKKDLIPVSVEPDGSVAQVRIPEATIYSVTNTLKF